jgi:protein transport protein SEC24
VQAALLYTSSAGERRIRIHTIVLPVTQSIPDMIETVEIDSVVNLLAKQAIDIACKTGLDNARQRVHQTTVEMLRGSRQLLTAPTGYPSQYGAPQMQPSADAPIPATLQLLPLYSMAIQKCLALRGGSEVRM